MSSAEKEEKGKGHSEDSSYRLLDTGCAGRALVQGGASS